jgi:hypothetical protein
LGKSLVEWPNALARLALIASFQSALGSSEVPSIHKATGQLLKPQ